MTCTKMAWLHHWRQWRQWPAWRWPGYTIEDNEDNDLHEDGLVTPLKTMKTMTCMKMAWLHHWGQWRQCPAWRWPGYTIEDNEDNDLHEDGLVTPLNTMKTMTCMKMAWLHHWRQWRQWPAWRWPGYTIEDNEDNDLHEDGLVTPLTPFDAADLVICDTCSTNQKPCTWTIDIKLTFNPQIDWHLVCRLTSKTYLDGWMVCSVEPFFFNQFKKFSIKIGIIYGYVQHRHGPSKTANQPIRNKYDKYLWRRKYNCATACADYRRSTSPVF